MGLLLDTVAFLWLAEGDARFSIAAREAIADPGNDVFLSAVSSWEIAIKYGLGRLGLGMPPDEFVPEQRSLHRIDTLVIDEAATLQAGKLPDLHRDPFDRLLVAQAIVGGLTIVTPDRLIRDYPVPVLWSR
ncbi:MAG: type II toxin-antitoxin system VapC family toxin [Chloroflexi bacterium]|nr:type II toxin-antitoxin system VapC family toxin [Chloroflexota bacterium]